MKNKNRSPVAGQHWRSPTPAKVIYNSKYRILPRGIGVLSSYAYMDWKLNKNPSNIMLLLIRGNDGRDHARRSFGYTQNDGA